MQYARNYATGVLGAIVLLVLLGLLLTGCDQQSQGCDPNDPTCGAQQAAGGFVEDHPYMTAGAAAALAYAVANHRANARQMQQYQAYRSYQSRYRPVQRVVVVHHYAPARSFGGRSYSHSSFHSYHR